jgi:hypothetical protein
MESQQWRYFSLRNENDLQGGYLEVYLQNQGQVVAFNPGPKNVFVEFVLWYREFVHARYPLYLFNSSSWDRLLLMPSTSEPDIIDFTGIMS